METILQISEDYECSGISFNVEPCITLALMSIQFWKSAATPARALDFNFLKSAATPAWAFKLDLCACAQLEPTCFPNISIGMHDVQELISCCDNEKCFPHISFLKLCSDEH